MRKLKAYAKSTRTAYRVLFQNTNLLYCCNEAFTSRRFETIWASIVELSVRGIGKFQQGVLTSPTGLQI